MLYYLTYLWNIAKVQRNLFLNRLLAQQISVASYWARWRLKSPACDCLLICLIRRKSKKTSKLCVTGLWEGNSPATGEFPAQRQVMQKMFPFDGVIMMYANSFWYNDIPIHLRHLRICSTLFIKIMAWCLFGITPWTKPAMSCNQYHSNHMQ